MSKLYYRKNGFLLSNGENIFSIDEPIKWDQVRLDIVFDNEYFGFNYAFSDKDVVLEFDRQAGFNIIQEQHKKLGVDMNCSLKFGYYTGDVFTVLYEGQLVGATYVEDATVIKCTLEKRSLKQKFLSRIDLPVDLFSPTSVDGLSLLPISRKKVVLPPLALVKQASFAYNTNVDVVVDYDYADPVLQSGILEGVSFVPPFKSTQNNIQQIENPVPVDGTLFYSGLEFDSGITQKNIKIKSLKVRYSFNYSTASHLEEPNIQYGISVYKKSNIAGGPTNGDLDAGFTVIPPPTYYNFITIAANEAGVKSFVLNEETGNLEFSLVEDEAIFIKCWLLHFDGGVVEDITNISPEEWLMEVEEEAFAASTQNEAVYIHEGIDRAIQLITDSSILKSSFFGRTDIGYAENGLQSDNFIMNGKLIRGLNESFAKSVKDIVKPLINLYALGMTFEKDVDNNEFIVIEPLENFFRNVLLHSFTVVSKYERSPVDELTFNELKFGFQKYPRDSQQNSFSEYLTQMFWSTPLKYFKNKFEKVADILLASTYFEYTRQQSFSKEPDTAYETDNDLFLLKIESTDGVYADASIRFKATNILLTVNSGNTPIPFLDGDKFTVSGHPTPENNKEYTITSIRYLYSPGFSLDDGFAYELTVEEGYTVVTSQEDCAVTVDFVGVDRYLPKLNRSFSQGMSIYNSYYKITNTLKSWAKVFNSGLFGYFGSGKIRFLSGISNTTLDKADYDLPDYKTGEVGELDKPLFSGDQITFETVIDWEVFNTLVSAFEGRHPDDKNYGYFELPNPKGVIEKGFANKISLDPTTQILKLTLLEKFDG